MKRRIYGTHKSRVRTALFLQTRVFGTCGLGYGVVQSFDAPGVVPRVDGHGGDHFVYPLHFQVLHVLRIVEARGQAQAVRVDVEAEAFVLVIGEGNEGRGGVLVEALVESIADVVWPPPTGTTCATFFVTAKVVERFSMIRFIIQDNSVGQTAWKGPQDNAQREQSRADLAEQKKYFL